MQNLAQNPTYFPRRTVTEAASAVNPHDGAGSSSHEVVRQVVVALLGEGSLREGKSEGAEHFSVFDSLTRVLPPMASQAAFHWDTLGKSFASMLETADFTVEVQARFLTFVYARVLGFMGPTERKGPGSLMTVDGSPVELSWVIPNRSKPRRGEPTRQIRFAIDPLHPETGIPLKGDSVLDYLTSPEGGLGVVSCPEQGMVWRKEIEKFLFPDHKGDEIPAGSRFFVGFDFSPSGTLTLKAYYNTAFCAPPGQLRITGKAPTADDDFKSLKDLLPRLHPTLSKPFETLISYVDGLEPQQKPLVGMLAVDCVEPDVNRLKMYCFQIVGTTWSDAQRCFTLGGALDSPNVHQALGKVEILWNNLFPNASSSKNVDASSVVEPDWPAKANAGFMPDGGLMFYYELYAGEDVVFPKFYMPVRAYCRDDLHVSNAVEKFCDEVGIEGPEVGERGKGWVAREVSKAYNHRKLDKSSGIQTHVTIGAKKVGWELTTYFSPEYWIQAGVM